MKTCFRCKLEKELSEYHKNKKRSDGVHVYCKMCTNELNRVNKDKKTSYNHEHYLKNKEALNIQSKKYQDLHKEELKLYWKNYTKEYYKNNKDAIIKRTSDYKKQKALLDPLFKEKFGIRRYISCVIKPEILKRDNFTCCMCLEKPNNLIIHHILPVKQYPDKTEDFSNLITLCPKCHKIAHNGNYHTYDPVWAKWALERNKCLEYL